MNAQMSSKRIIRWRNDQKNVFDRFVTEEKVLEVEVEAGVADGYQIPFLAEGQLIFSFHHLFIDLFSRRTTYGR